MNPRSWSLVAAALASWGVACTPTEPQGAGLDASEISDGSRSLDAGTIPGEDAAPEPSRDAGPGDADRADGGEEPPTGLDVDRWRRAVIYFVMTDRYVDGDPTNNGGPDCYDPQAPNLFHGGDFAGIQQHLGYLEELGADSLWITPLPRQTPRRGDWCGYHGYWANWDDPDDGALEPHLGDDAALHALIAAMHERGQALIVDQVVNHPGREAPITRTHPDWFHPHEGCAQAGDPQVYCDLAGLPDFAHERPEVARYLTDLSVNWVRRFAFDGIRMDTVKHVSLEYFRDHYVPGVLAARPNLYLMGEIYDEGSYDLQTRYLQAGFQGFFDFPLRRALIQSLAKGGSLAPLAVRVREGVERLGLEAALLRPTFLDNHDVPRFIREFDGRYSTPERIARYRLALAVLFTVPGIPQLYMGDELGAAQEDNRVDHPSWAFQGATRAGSKEGYLGDPEETFRWVAQLARLRRETPALHSGNYVELWRPDGGAELWAFYRRVGESRVIVAFNAGDTSVEGHALPTGRNGKLNDEDQAAIAPGASYRVLAGDPAARLEFEAQQVRVHLAPRAVAIFTLP